MYNVSDLYKLFYFKNHNTTPNPSNDPFLPSPSPSTRLLIPSITFKSDGPK